MDFEEMQVIWNSQTERPMYALDLNALHASVKRKGRGIERGVNAMEIGMIIISILVAAVLASEPIFEGTDRHQFVSALALLAVAAYLLVGRLQRREREQACEPSLLGDLDRALSQVDYLIKRARTFAWWFLAPAYLTLALSYAFKFESKPLWVLPLVLVAAALGLYLVRLELRCVHLPRKRDLEALRSKLTAEG